MNILIGLPCYSGLLHLDCMNSLLDFHKVRLNFSVMGIGNESLIPRGRNTVISYFYHMEQFTHLFFLDADIGISGESVIRLLQHNKDIISAPVALKGKDTNGNPVYNVGNLLSEEENGLVTTDKAGNAVLIFSRGAVNALVKHAKDNEDIYQSNPHTRGDAKQLEMYDIFKTGVVNGEYLSEDYWVCRTLKELGYEIFVDTIIKTRHNGMYEFM